MVMVRPAVRMRGSASTSTPTVRLDKSASNIGFSSKLKNAQGGKAFADQSSIYLKVGSKSRDGITNPYKTYQNTIIA